MTGDSGQGRRKNRVVPELENITGKMVREIDECLRKVNQVTAQQAVRQIISAKRVFLTGKGRSGLAIRGFAIRLMHLGIDAHLVGESTTPPIGADDCLIIGSGSGTTSTLLPIAAKAKEVGAKIALFTIDPGSPLAQQGDYVVVIPAPSPKVPSSTPTGASIQPMGSLFEQCLFLLLDAIVIVLMQESGITSTEMFARHANLE
jgi:6-phospho-3-hexuloisomerase